MRKMSRDNNDINIIYDRARCRFNMRICRYYKGLPSHYTDRLRKLREELVLLHGAFLCGFIGEDDFSTRMDEIVKKAEYIEFERKSKKWVRNQSQQEKED